MNSMQNNGPDDKSPNNKLEDDLEQLGQAYQRLAPEEPPGLLDQAILNSAHRAVEKKAGWMDFGWIHGLTTAAVVVLALTIILTQRQPASLEESGLSPADADFLERARNGISEPVELLSERSANELEYKDDLNKELKLEPRNELISLAPASKTPEETIRQLNEPAKAMVAKQAVATPADETAAAAPAPTLTGALRPDVASTVADRIKAERSQLSAEELRLQAILQLKRDGNDSWKTELESFVESYPDYPLPDELKN